MGLREARIVSGREPFTVFPSGTERPHAFAPPCTGNHFLLAPGCLSGTSSCSPMIDMDLHGALGFHGGVLVLIIYQLPPQCL